MGFVDTFAIGTAVSPICQAVESLEQQLVMRQSWETPPLWYGKPLDINHDQPLSYLNHWPVVSCEHQLSATLVVMDGFLSGSSGGDALCAGQFRMRPRLGTGESLWLTSMVQPCPASWGVGFNAVGPRCDSGCSRVALLMQLPAVPRWQRPKWSWEPQKRRCFCCMGRGLVDSQISKPQVAMVPARLPSHSSICIYNRAHTNLGPSPGLK